MATRPTTPMDKTRSFEAAGAFTAQGHLDRAAYEYERILDADPNDIRALQKLADVRDKAGRVSEAVALWLRLAAGYTEQGFFLKALSIYKRALKARADLPEAHLSLCRLYLLLESPQDAVRTLSTLEALHRTAGRVAEALLARRRRLDLEPFDREARLALATDLEAAGLYAEACGTLRRVLAKTIDPTERARLEVRVAKLEPLRPAAVARALTRPAPESVDVALEFNLPLPLAAGATELDGSLPPAALFELGAAHASRGNLVAAAQMLDKLLRTVGASQALLEATHYELGACRERLGHFATALAHFQRVRTTNPAFRDVKLRVLRLEARIPCALPPGPALKVG